MPVINKSKTQMWIYMNHAGKNMAEQGYANNQNPSVASANGVSTI
jgi:hypothetical protein